jgi:hypothetical protein
MYVFDSSASRARWIRALARRAPRTALESNTHFLWERTHCARRAAKIATRSSRSNRNLFDF